MRPLRLYDRSLGEDSIFHRIISGQSGAWALPARAVLRVLESAYAVGVGVRNARYDRRGPAAELPVPVISVGNLTVGGTGKTPFVIDLVRRLEGLGLSPAVVARGYRAAVGEPNDEELLIRKRCPAVVYAADADRAAAGMIACERHGADVIVLDDGFQHRRVTRALDIVLVDATCPFGYDHLLPRGLLREPPESLARAQVVVLTRADQVSSSARSRVQTRLNTLAPEAAHIECKHAVTSIEHLSGSPMDESLEGRRAVLFAGIARPQAFLTTVQTLGIEVVATRWWSDHHRYRSADVDGMLASGRFPAHDWLLTTEKDAVKLASLGGLDEASIGVVTTSIEFPSDDAETLDRALRPVLAEAEKWGEQRSSLLLTPTAPTAGQRGSLSSRSEPPSP